MSALILIVDDEEDLLELVRFNLDKEGFDILCASTGEEALKIVRNTPPDLIVLDLMLPGIDGLSVTKELKNSEKTANIPIIMLTAKGEERDVVKGLETGADDYVVKPFSPNILIARVKAALRRIKDSDYNKDENGLIEIRDLTIDPNKYRVLIKNQPVELTLSEFQILYFLVKKPGWVFTRSQIVDAIRGDGYAVTDRSIDVQVVGIRKKLKSCGNYIETVRGVGYRFKE